MTRSMLGRALSLALVGAAAFLSACGGGGKPVDPSTPPPTTLPPPPRVLVQGAGPIAAMDGGLVEFNVDTVGRLDITVDWTFATNDVDVVLIRGTCTEEQATAGSCNILVIADSATAKPERLTFPNAAVGLYTVVAVNFGPDDESVALQVVLTPGAAGPPMASSSRTLRSLRGPIRRLVPLR